MKLKDRWQPLEKLRPRLWDLDHASTHLANFKFIGESAITIDISTNDGGKIINETLKTEKMFRKNVPAAFKRGTNS